MLKICQSSARACIHKIEIAMKQRVVNVCFPPESCRGFPPESCRGSVADWHVRFEPMADSCTAAGDDII